MVHFLIIDFFIWIKQKNKASINNNEDVFIKANKPKFEKIPQEIVY
jgi:hypothetical protein